MSQQQLREIPNVGPESIADIASALMDRSLRPEDPIALLALPTAPAISERDQELIRMRQQGATLAQIARRFGISRGRVAQILERDGW
jgi:DNA-binding CsgD family transcriptional regulator